jgi:L-histidine N-alpha-methyltransferase
MHDTTTAPRRPRLRADAREEILAGLAGAPPSIAPKFLYDQLGSRLFEAITALPEYYPTRTEAELLAEHLPAITAAAPVDGGTLIDLGAGSCAKAAALFPHVRPGTYVAVDIAGAFLGGAVEQLQRLHPGLPMVAVETDFTAGLELPAAVPRQRRLFFYPGSSIGNFTPSEAVAFLRTVRGEMQPDSVLWIGVDLQKDPALLVAAYDDALGVTAAFNRNVLLHVNRLAGTDFALADWRHVALYDERAGRIEMHLEAVRDVDVRWRNGGRTFRAGQRIHTENSYKYTVPHFRSVLGAADLHAVGHWTDPAGWFAFFVARPAAGGGDRLR